MTTTSTSAKQIDDRDHAPVEIEILHPGTYAGVRIGAEQLREVAANFERLKGTHDVPVAVRLGHDDRQVLDQEDGHPAFGWVEALREQGGRLLATVVGMPTALRQAINRRAYRKVSPALYPRWEATEAERNLRSGVRGLVLQHVAFLGADIPRIRSLADLPRVVADEHCEEVIVCSQDPPTSGVYAGDVKPTEPGSLAERVAVVDRRLAEMSRATKAALAVADRWTEKPLPFTAFAPSAAAQRDGVGNLAHRFLSEVEAALQRHGWSRNDVDARRRAAREVLVAWKNEASAYGEGPTLADELSTDDFERAVQNYAAAGGDDDPDRRALPAGTAAPAGVWNSTKAAAPPTVTTRALRPTSTITTRREDDVRPAAVTTTKRTYMSEDAKFEADRLQAIAAEKRLNVRSADGRRLAQALLFQERAVPLLHARTWDEAHAAALRSLGHRPELLQGAEAAMHREAVLLVMKERPDLHAEVTQYGRTNLVPEVDQPVGFAEAVKDELRDIDVFDQHRLGEATRRAVARDPSRAPRHYGSAGR